MSAWCAGGAGALLLFGWLLLRFTDSAAPGTGADVPIYLLSAQWLAPLAPASEAAEHAARHSLFPPLYPLLLALGAGGDIRLARAVTALCLPLAVLACAAWARAAGRGPREAIAFAACVALLPATWLASLEQLSEPLYLALSLGALACAARSANRRGPALLAAALLCGLAALARSAGAALVLAFGIWLLRAPGEPRSRRLPALALAAAPPLAWTAARALLDLGASYADVHAARLELVAADPLRALAAVLAGQAAALAGAATRLFSLFPTPLERGLAAGVALLALAGWASRLRRLELDALYLGLYLLVLLAWPFPAHAERFLYAVAPLLLFHAGESAAELASRSRPGLAARLRAALLLLCLLLPLPALHFLAARHAEGSARSYADFTRTPRWFTRRALAQAEFDAVMRRDEVAAMRRAGEIVPPGACVFAVKPLELMLHADRVSRLPPPEELEASAFDSALADCDYVFAEPLVVFPYRSAFHPVAALGERFELIERIEASPEAGGRRAPPSALLGRIRRAGR